MKILLAASGMDGLLTLVIFLAITAVSTWLQRKQQKAEEESAPPPPPSPRPRRQPQPAPERAEPGTAKKPLSWEEELRRLLEGEPTAPPPPIIVTPAPKPAPPPLPRRAPAAAHQDSGEMDVGLPVQLRGLKQSVEAYHKASQLEQKVQAHMRRVEAQVTAHAPSPVIAKAPAAPARAKTMFRSREDVRSAIIASIVLGPPKASGN